MDAFFASVEQRDNPNLKGLPIAVGGSPDRRGGVVATASYEARKFGVKSAMSSLRAVQLCPQLIFVKPRFEQYKAVSHQIREIFFRYTDLVEPLSLDEAFLDVTTDKQHIGSAIEVARCIRQQIRDELGLTASAGVSINKFVAKIASDYFKPDGLTFIGPSSVVTFIEQLPIEKFYGVGKVTAAKMKRLGIFTGADLKKMNERMLIRNFGKSGRFFFNIARGIDHRAVQPDRAIKSISVEDTFPYDLEQRDEMRDAIDRLTELLCERLSKRNVNGRTITLKIKFADFRQVSRSFTFPAPLADYESIYAKACNLLEDYGAELGKVRLLGIGLSNLDVPREALRETSDEPQLNLF